MNLKLDSLDSPEHRTRGTWRVGCKVAPFSWRLLLSRGPQFGRLLPAFSLPLSVCPHKQRRKSADRPTGRRLIRLFPREIEIQMRVRVRPCMRTHKETETETKAATSCLPPLSSSAAPMRPCVAHSRSAFQTDVAAATTSSTSQPSSSTSEPGESPKLGNACVSCSVRSYMNVTC